MAAASGIIIDNLSQTDRTIPTMLWMMDASTRREAYLAVAEVNDEGKPTRGLRFFSFNIPCRLEDSKHHKVLEPACKAVEPLGGSSAIAPEQLRARVPVSKVDSLASLGLAQLGQPQSHWAVGL